MEVLFFIIAISTLLAICFLISFLWAVSTGQYKDDYTPSIRILTDENETNNKSKN